MAMGIETLEEEIRKAIADLLQLARILTWNKIPDRYEVILTKIEDSGEDLRTQRKSSRQANKQKIPVPLEELMPLLRQLYDDCYDINLQIFKTTKSSTIVDVRYYPKSSLTPEYRMQVSDRPPMLHGKVALPPWSFGQTKKFDLHWERYDWLTRLRLRLMERSRR